MSKVKTSKYYMKQCKLERNITDGVSTTTTWIPEQYAIVGNYIKLKDEHDVWVDGWRVILASTECTSYEDCNKQSQDYKGMATSGNAKTKNTPSKH
jgi:hypothetical protein